jgi:hypothetical protein
MISMQAEFNDRAALEMNARHSLGIEAGHTPDIT